MQVMFSLAKDDLLELRDEIKGYQVGVDRQQHTGADWGGQHTRQSYAVMSPRCGGCHLCSWHLASDSATGRGRGQPSGLWWHGTACCCTLVAVCGPGGIAARGCRPFTLQVSGASGH